MYENQTDTLIKQRMLDSIPTDTDKSEGSLTYNSVAAGATEFAQEYVALDTLLSLAFAETSYGEYLHMRAAEHGIYPKLAAAATGVVTFYGVDGTSIPVGTLVQTVDGLQYYVTSADIIISGGSVNANIVAAATGASYNVPANTITVIPVQITGVTSVTNAKVISTGADAESDEDFLDRFLSDVQTPVTSGNKSQYKAWALSVIGVGNARIIPLANGNGTVTVIIINSNKQPASVDLITSVQNYIDDVRPIGATVTVVSATALPINISLSVTKADGYTDQQIIDNISSSVTEFLKEIAFDSSYASYALIGNKILNSSGVVDYGDLKLNDTSESIVINDTQVAILGTVTLT